MDKRILNLREEIDEIDEKIITLLKSRMDLSKEVGELKAALHIPVEDKGREEEIIQRLGELADGNLKEEQLMRIFTAVFKSSKQIQK
jgi:monofunctional chorismate mutase